MSLRGPVRSPVSLPCGLSSPFLHSSGRTFWLCLQPLSWASLPPCRHFLGCPPAFESLPSPAQTRGQWCWPIALLCPRRTSSARQRQRRCSGPRLLCSSMAAPHPRQPQLLAGQTLSPCTGPTPGAGFGNTLLPSRGEGWSCCGGLQRLVPGRRCALSFCSKGSCQSPRASITRCWRRSRALPRPQEPPASSGLPSPGRLCSPAQPGCPTRLSPGFVTPEAFLRRCL